MMKPMLSLRILACALGGAVAALTLMAGGAFGAGVLAQDRSGAITLAQQRQQSNPFSALVGERRERRADRQLGAVERYVLAADNRAFLIEARTRTARVKFLCGPDDQRLDCTLDPQAPAPEIYLLTVTRGPRGDSIFKNADGETLVRIASYGGATVQWPGDNAGSAASKSFGDDHAVALPAVGFEAAERRAKAATAIISALTGSPIIFDLAPPAPDEETDASVLADAILRTTIGVRAVAGDASGARILGDRIARVLFETGTAPDARFEDNALIIEYVPDQDISGRLSSRAVERFLEESL